jgi:stearoyl-CoA desaturase (delta-9 desaturase)
LKTPPAQVLRNEQRLGSRVIEKAASELAAQFNPERIAAAVAAAVEASSLAVLQERLLSAQHKAADVLAGLHLPHLPTHREIQTRALAMFAKTPSLDDIVNRAYAVVLEAVGARLCAVAVPVRR